MYACIYTSFTDAAQMTHLGDRIICVCCLQCCQEFVFLPKPEDQHPLGAPCQAYQVLGIRRESNADKLLNRHVSCTQNLSLPALLMLQVKHSDGGSLSII